jgi:alkylation response protein AidB-like acyl-CoA dehydrogenase
MAEASAVKVLGTELCIEVYRLLLEIVETAGLVLQGEPGMLFGGILENAYRSATTLTFGGGVNEVQRDIIAMAGLGLPRARR